MTSNSFTPDQAATADSPERLIAQACRVLAHQGLAEDILGHVSLRDGADALYVRSRGPNERGLLFTDPGDVKLVGLDGIDWLAQALVGLGMVVMIGYLFGGPPAAEPGIPPYESVE